MKRTLVLVLAVAVTALAAAALVVTLRTAHQPATTPEHGGDAEYEITGPVPSGAGPGLAAQQGLSVMFSWQPNTDPSPGAALTRATPWLAGQLAREAGSPPATGIKPLSEWARWREAGDIVVATAHTSGVRVPTDSTAVVSVALTQTVLHRDGTSTRWRVMNIDASTVSGPDGWRLSAYTITR
ncbi:hypothetical protein [Nocardia jejuensis]|uniref:hypothetical protein n=1 Tax=Nocardia jejuensis TaxID=328049 RepID=UPI000832CFFA|nr:hypothetical protein [Nocardia jejuensis]